MSGDADLPREAEGLPSILILTPVKDAAPELDGYFERLERLAYPAAAISLGLLESDSTDDTYRLLMARADELRQRYRRVTLAKRDFCFALPAGVPRWASWVQVPRRITLAKSRNHLLFAALRDERWVLWLDVDVIDYPPDVIQQMLATERDIVAPHCVTSPGGPTFDWNSWRDHGEVRMDALRDGPPLVRLDAVGATMLLVRADAHRDGLVFPPLPYGRPNPLARNPNPFLQEESGEFESEGLGLMAKDMGYECWGMPRLEVIHHNA